MAAGRRNRTANGGDRTPDARGRGRGTTFADLVRAEQSRPARPDRRRLPPGRHGDLLVDAAHRRSTLVDAHLDAPRAGALVRGGATVAFDPCGCGGACGISTLEPDRLARLTSAGDPIVSDDRRHPGELSSWVAEDDRSTLLVLASGRVVWGRNLA